MSRPSNDVIASAYTQGGSIRKAAQILGYGATTLRHWAEDDAEIAAIFGTIRTEPPEVDDPQALIAASKDAEVRQLRRDLKQLSEKLGKREEWMAEIVENARVPVPVPRFTPRYGGHSKNLPNRSIVLPIFDMQYGQNVVPGDVPFGKGAFNEAIFDDRLEAYVDRVSRLLIDRRISTNFTELHLVLGGDLVEGDEIFAGQSWQLQKHPVRQVLDLRVKLARALESLIRVSKEQLGVEKVALYCVPGNHGKVGGKRAGARPADYSWDYMACELVRDMLREQPIDLAVNEAAGALVFQTLGHTFLVIHGDELKGHAGIPFYGFSRLDGRAIRLSEVIYDYGLSGHIHQPASIPNGSGGEWNVQPDWVGGNNLSKHIVAASRPGAKLLIVGAKQGVCTEERIYFDDRRERTRATIHDVRG